MPTRFLPALMLAFILPVTAAANDSAAILEAGGLRLVRDVPVEILSEDLFLSPSRVEVNYVFRAADDRGVSTLVAFPLPEYDLSWHGSDILGGPDDSVEARSAFQVWVDGEEISPLLEVRALRNGIDVTEFLERYDVPVGSLDHAAIMASLQAMPQEVKDWLGDADIVRWNDDYDPEPRWTLKATYYWAQTFAPDQDVHVRHIYTPINGGFIITDPVLRDIEPGAYCMTQAETSGLRTRLEGSSAGAVVATQLRYVLTTGANWQGTIGRFRLTIDKERPEDMVSLCFDGLTRTAPTQFQHEVLNFVPQRDLDVIFFRAVQ